MLNVFGVFAENSLYKLQCLHRLQISFSSWLVLQGGWAWDYINVCFSWMNAGNSHSYETPHEDDNELHDFIKSCWLNYFPTFIATSHIISLSNLRSFGRKKPIIGQIICMYSWDLSSCKSWNLLKKTLVWRYAQNYPR